MTNDELRIRLSDLSAQCDGSREQMAVNGVLCALIASMFDNSQPLLLMLIQPYIDSEHQKPTTTIEHEPDMAM